jgi:hypothetical protein
MNKMMNIIRMIIIIIKISGLKVDRVMKMMNMMMKKRKTINKNKIRINKR